MGLHGAHTTTYVDAEVELCLCRVDVRFPPAVSHARRGRCASGEFCDALPVVDFVVVAQVRVSVA